MLYTNLDEHGGEFVKITDNEISNSTEVLIATGYMSQDIIDKYFQKTIEIVNKGGIVKLLLGMAFYEGVTKKKLEIVKRLSLELKDLSAESGVYVNHNRRYHGKLYKFTKDSESKYYIGSSNFSTSGLRSNIEATAKIDDKDLQREIESFLTFLFSKDESTRIEDAEIVSPGTREYRERLIVTDLSELDRHEFDRAKLSGLQYFDYDLSRISNSMKSSLNAYFAKGRLSRSTGKIAPRGWYEGALIAPVDLISSPLYPHGDFTAFTDDGYIIPLSTRGQNDKNIESKGNLKLLGMWIKTRLQNSGALKEFTPVTEETLDAYGRDTIRFYKIDEAKYFLDFSV